MNHVEYLESEILMCVCVCVWGVKPEDTTHYRSKTVKSRILFPDVCGRSHFEDLIRFKKSFSVYPA